MKRTMVYLSDELHEGLRRLAFERRSSMAELIRAAVERVFGEDIEDLRDGEAELRRYYANRRSAVTLEELKARGRAVVRR